MTMNLPNNSHQVLELKFQTMSDRKMCKHKFKEFDSLLLHIPKIKQNFIIYKRNVGTLKIYTLI